MFGDKVKDNIGILERKAEDSLSTVTDFIEMFQSAQEDAKELNETAAVEIARLNEVQKKCNRVTSFTKRLLEVSEVKK